MPSEAGDARAMDFVRNASSTALTQVARTVLGLGLAVLLARWLSETDRGLYAVVATFAIFADQGSQLGMRLAVIYRGSLQPETRKRAVGAALELTSVAFAALALVALLFAEPLRARFLDGGERGLVALSLALGAADLFSGLWDAIARGIDRFDLRNADQLAIALVTLAASWIALVPFQAGLWGVLAATAAARLVLLAVFGVLVLRQSGVDLAPDRKEIAESLRFGAKVHVQTLLARLHERVDVLLMAALRVDPAQIAVYAVAVSVIDRLRVVPDSIGAALLPQLTTTPPAQAGAYAARVTRHLVFWVCLSGLGLALAAPFALPLLFGRAYAASLPSLLVLLPATAMLTVRTMLANYFVATGRPGFNAKVQAVAVAVNLAANLWAIPRYGILGAAFASLVSYGVEASATVLAFRRVTHCSVGETLLATRKDLAPYVGRMRRLRARFGGT